MKHYIVARKGSKSEKNPHKCSLRFATRQNAKAFRNRSKAPMLLKVMEVEDEN